MIIFVDTSAWLALVYKNDKNHLKAVNSYKEILKIGYLVISTDYVLDETITRIRYDLGFEEAVQFIDQIKEAANNDFLRIERVEEKNFKKAVSLFKKYEDQLFSFTDCTSFIICRENNIKEVFAFDKDFLTMGFILADY